jgi:hypothetical protein
MDFKLFTDLYNALKNVFTDLKALTNIPIEERKKYRNVLGETFSMLDVSLNMIISRLGDILIQSNNDLKLSEIKNLQYKMDWLETERKFRLCTNLRATLAETKKIRDKLVGRVAVNNWNDLIGIMENILGAEDQLADYISKEFYEISGKALSITTNSIDFVSQLKTLEDFRNRLIEERRNLIKQETTLYDEII